MWIKQLAGLLFSIGFILSPMLSVAAVYQWRDQSGQLHFTDQPRKGAKKVKLPASQYYTPKKIELLPPPKSVPSAKSAKTAIVPSYARLQIVEPVNEATIRSGTGSIAIHTIQEPTLKRGDRLVLLVDGQPYGDPQIEPRFLITGIDRGEHTLAVQVIDAQARVIQTSELVTIYLHRPRVNMVPRS